MTKFLTPETPTNEFVTSPEICKKLVDLGLTRESLFRWQIDLASSTKRVQTFAWDVDGYYERASEIIDSTIKVYYLPAYTVTDLDNALPPYCLCKNATIGYDVLCDAFYNVPSVTAQRLPDALALMLERLLKHRLLDPKTVNTKIASLQNLSTCSK